MTHFFRVPLVIDGDSNELIFIEDVRSGSKQNLVCFECGESMIPVNKEGNIQKPHFRHKNEECGVSFESYIHWLSKEIFQEIESLSFPSIDFESLFNTYWNGTESFQSRIRDLFKKYNLSDDFNNLNNFNILLQDVSIIKFIKFKKESSIKNISGRIQPDIVIELEDKKYIIEPFYSNPIDEIKFRKIENIGISAISINLNKFLLEQNFIYSKEQFKNFIQNDIQSKQWIFVNSEDRLRLQSLFIIKLEAFIVEKLPELDKYTDLVKFKNDLPEKEKPFRIGMQELREKKYSILDLLGGVESEMRKINKALISLNNDSTNCKSEMNFIEMNFFNNSD